MIERKNVVDAAKAAAVAQERCSQAENERDSYRHLAERMYTCLQSIIQCSENMDRLQRHNLNNSGIPPELLQSAQGLLNKTTLDRIDRQNGIISHHLYDSDFSLGGDEVSSGEIDDDMVLDELHSDDNSSIREIDDDNSISSDMSLESHGNEVVSASTGVHNTVDIYSRQQLRSVSISEDM